MAKKPRARAAVEQADAYLEKSSDASRIGKAVEHLIAASCILASQGALNVSTTLVDDEGVDLVFHRRDGTATLAVQVKSRRTTAVGVARGRFMASVRHQTFRPRPGFYLLFVTVDDAHATFGPVWLVPSLDFEERARQVGARRRWTFSASLSPDARDQWRPYRLERIDLAPAILHYLQHADE